MRFNAADFLKDTVGLFGGIRFRYMDLYDVHGMRPLFSACAETLLSVVLDPTDPLGEKLPLKSTQALANDFAAESSLRGSDLWWDKALRTLQVPWSSVGRVSSDGLPNASRFLKHMLSTITSPVFSMVVAFCGDDHFRRVEPWFSDLPIIHELSPAERAEEISLQRRILKVFREVGKARDFQLKLCANISSCAGEESWPRKKRSVCGV